MEYRVSFLIQAIGMVLNNASFIFIWWALFSHTDTIGGYQMDDVMTIWALTSSAFGLTFVLFGNVGTVSRLIVTGELDTYLLQPSDVIVNMLCAKSVLSAWGDLAYGYILIVLFKGFSPYVLVMFTLFIITGALLLTSLLLISSSLTFYMGNSDNIVGLAREFLVSFSLYPEGIFTSWLKYVLYSLIPVGFFSYLPARIIDGLNPIWILAVLAVALIWVTLAYALFYRGLKRYESGNLIVSKM